ncbi:hypothetical protein V6Z12_D02G061800 [Gossypium hirsutum]
MVVDSQHKEVAQAKLQVNPEVVEFDMLQMSRVL